jgi:hypothetical protein
MVGAKREAELLGTVEVTAKMVQLKEWSNQLRRLTCFRCFYPWHNAYQLLVWELIDFGLLVVSPGDGDIDGLA